MSLDKDSAMESKAWYANKFSILGFETSLTLKTWYRFGDKCYPLISTNSFEWLKLIDTWTYSSDFSEELHFQL